MRLAVFDSFCNTAALCSLVACGSDYMLQGHQVPALNLARLVQQEAQESAEFRSAIFSELITTINTVLEHYSSLSGSSRTLSDAIRNQRPGEFGSGCATALREEGLRALLNCFPAKGAPLHLICVTASQSQSQSQSDDSTTHALLFIYP